MRKGFWAFVVIIALIFLSILFFYSEIKSVATLFVQTYGLTGLFVLVVIMDTIIQPMSPDILVFGSTFGGANLLWASLVGGFASVLAGIIGYLIGRYIGEEGFVKWFNKEHLDKGKEFFSKYGVWAIVFGALSPLPYSAFCWSAGVYRMRFIPFLLSSILTRLPRFFLFGLIGLML
jgi:membrane protein YqaA with SNARE-associated domain